MTTWIPANTPPNDTRLVLVHEPASNIGYALASFRPPYRTSRYEWIDTMGEIIDVSHWMELPAEPAP